MKRLLLCLSVLLLIACGGTYPGRVAALYWIRAYSVENWQQNQHDDWSMPTGAELISTESRRHGEHWCGSHQEEEENTQGTISLVTVDEYCPTYDDWYTYKIWEWTPTRQIRADGLQDTIPYWPDDYILSTTERIGGQLEEYHIIVVVEGQQYNILAPLAPWSELSIGGTVQVAFNGFGQAKGIQQ